MRLTIKATNIEHTNAIDTYLTKRMAELERVLGAKEKSSVARLEIGQTSKHHKDGKEVFFAEVTMHVKKKDFRVVAKAGNLYEAIDNMKDIIVREVLSHHEQMRSKEKKGAREMKRRTTTGTVLP